MPSEQQDFDPEILFTRPLMAHLATSGAGGAAFGSPVWFLWEEGAFWTIGDLSSSFLKRLAVQPVCAVTITEFDTEEGILLHLGLRGRAEILPMDAARFQRLLARYLGPDPTTWNPWFIDNIAAIDDPDGRLIRIAPDHLVTKNVSYFRTGPNIIQP